MGACPITLQSQLFVFLDVRKERDLANILDCLRLDVECKYAMQKVSSREG